MTSCLICLVRILWCRTSTVSLREEKGLKCSLIRRILWHIRPTPSGEGLEVSHLRCRPARDFGNRLTGLVIPHVPRPVRCEAPNVVEEYKNHGFVHCGLRCESSVHKESVSMGRIADLYPWGLCVVTLHSSSCISYWHNSAAWRLDLAVEGEQRRPAQLCFSK